MKLEMSKNHKKKYNITNIAIEKIPYIKIKNVEEKQNRIINNLTKAVLNISKNENNSNEVSITYDMKPNKKSDKILGIALGTSDEVDPLSDTTSCHIITSKSDCVVVSLHNHPSLSIVSLTDINFFLEYESICIMVIISNLGKISYLQKCNEYNKNKAIKYLNSLKKKHKMYVDEKGWYEAAIGLVKEFLKNCKKYGIEYRKR